jgi:putative transposase
VLFKAHLDDALVSQIREATHGNYVLGNPQFQADIERALGWRARKGKAGRPKANPTRSSE